MARIDDCLFDRIQKIKKHLEKPLKDDTIHQAMNESLTNAEKALNESEIKMLEAFYDLDNWLSVTHYKGEINDNQNQ